MITLFAAAPGTHLIEYDGPANTLDQIRIVGWQHVQGNIVFPVTAMPFAGLTHGKAVMHPDGRVEDPTHGVVFDNTDDWIEFLSTTPDRPRAEPQKAAEAETRTPKNDKPEVPVIFGTKTYKTKSFWAYDSGDDAVDGVFEIEGEVPYPNDIRCKKINRDEFLALKKSTAVVIPVKGEVPVVEDEEEDDISELV